MTYKRESSLHFLSIHAVHLAFEPVYGALEQDVTYHSIQGEFMYCGLLTDGQVLVREEDMDEVLPLLDLVVFKVEGTSMYVRSGEACTDVQLHVKHISTEHIEEDDDEDEEMIFMAYKKRGSIMAKAINPSKTQGVLKHLLERPDLGFA
jgi:hypothetical protein